MEAEGTKSSQGMAAGCFSGVIYKTSSLGLRHFQERREAHPVGNELVAWQGAQPGWGLHLWHVSPKIRDVRHPTAT